VSVTGWYVLEKWLTQNFSPFYTRCIQWPTNEQDHYRPSATAAVLLRQNALAVGYQHLKQYILAEAKFYILDKVKLSLCLSIKHHAMKNSRKGDIVPIFFTSALDGGEWSASSPGRLTPGETAIYRLSVTRIARIYCICGHRVQIPPTRSYRRYEHFKAWWYTEIDQAVTSSLLFHFTKYYHRFNQFVAKWDLATPATYL
jgi:hypothetical protein